MAPDSGLQILCKNKGNYIYIIYIIQLYYEYHPTPTSYL